MPSQWPKPTAMPYKTLQWHCLHCGRRYLCAVRGIVHDSTPWSQVCPFTDSTCTQPLPASEALSNCETTAQFSNALNGVESSCTSNGCQHLGADPCTYLPPGWTGPCSGTQGMYSRGSCSVAHGAPPPPPPRANFATYRVRYCYYLCRCSGHHSMPKPADVTSLCVAVNVLDPVSTISPLVHCPGSPQASFSSLPPTLPPSREP